MERWVQILIGTILSSVGLYVFYLIFEKFFKNCLKGSQAKEVTNGVDRIRLRVKQVAGTGTSSHEDREEMEQLVYEEYDTEEHEVLAVVLENQSTTVGVSLFLSDREVEYYYSRFPDCCSRHTTEEDIPVRSFVTAVAAWAEKWTLASCVNILSQDEAVVRNIGIKHTELWRKASQFESKHDFRLYTQWTDNYMCDEVSSDELWYELIGVAKAMLSTSGASEETEAVHIWENLPVAHWRRRRIEPGAEHFHASVPHPGEVTPPTSSNPSIPVTDNLVNL